MAGHSKWANIQHRKGRQDAVRSKLFSKFSKEITVAAKLGDSDPDKNPRLRLAVKEAKNNSVPKDVIDRAIKKSIADDLNNFEEIRYEGFAPFGIALIVETLTDNKNRTASNIRTLFNKNGGSLGTQGSVSHSFSQTGVIRINQNEIDENSVYELVIEIGVDEFLVKNGFYEIHCKKNDISLFVLDAAMIFEAKLEHMFDSTLLITADKDTRLKRAVKRHNISLEQIKSRMSLQLSESKKKDKVDYIINNNGTIKQLENRLKKFYSELNLP